MWTYLENELPPLFEDVLVLLQANNRYFVRIGTLGFNGEWWNTVNYESFEYPIVAWQHVDIPEFKLD